MDDAHIQGRSRMKTATPLLLFMLGINSAPVFSHIHSEHSDQLEPQSHTVIGLSPPKQPSNQFESQQANQNTVAQRITAENASRLIQTGPDATGGIGDWHLSNGVICATISGVDHESELSTKGGVLIDLGFCGRDDDHYTFHQDLIDGKRTRPLDAQSIRTESDNNSASVIVDYAENGIEQTTRYRLENNSSSVLHLSLIHI